MKIGIDLDNTLVCYDAVFESLAREKGIALAESGATKKSIRDAVRAAAGNDVWTEFQGIAYGPRMKDAAVMPGAEDFLAWARAARVPFFVISHKTRRSAIGGHDLHAPATAWLAARGFTVGQNAFLEETREGKFKKIGSLGLTHFVDDLEEFLTDPAFPKAVERLHYAPEGTMAEKNLRAFRNWSGILDFFKKQTA